MLAFIVGVSGCKEAPKVNRKYLDSICNDMFIDLSADTNSSKDHVNYKDSLKSFIEKSERKSKEYFKHGKNYWYEIQVKVVLTNGCEFEKRLTGSWIEHTSPSFLEIKELFKNYVKPFKIKDFEVSSIKIIDEKYALTKTTSFEPCNNQPLTLRTAIADTSSIYLLKKDSISF